MATGRGKKTIQEIAATISSENIRNEKKDHHELLRHRPRTAKEDRKLDLFYQICHVNEVSTYLSIHDLNNILTTCKSLYLLALKEKFPGPYNTNASFFMAVFGYMSGSLAYAISQQIYFKTMSSPDMGAAAFYKIHDAFGEEMRDRYLAARDSTLIFRPNINILDNVPRIEQYHTLAINMVWTMAQIHKKRPFMLFSPINEFTIYRQSIMPKGAIPAAFTYEISAAVLAEYEPTHHNFDEFNNVKAKYCGESRVVTTLTPTMTGDARFKVTMSSLMEQGATQALASAKYMMNRISQAVGNHINDQFQQQFALSDDDFEEKPSASPVFDDTSDTVLSPPTILDSEESEESDIFDDIVLTKKMRAVLSSSDSEESYVFDDSVPATNSPATLSSPNWPLTAVDSEESYIFGDDVFKEIPIETRLLDFYYSQISKDFTDSEIRREIREILEPLRTSTNYMQDINNIVKGINAQKLPLTVLIDSKVFQLKPIVSKFGLQRGDAIQQLHNQLEQEFIKRGRLLRSQSSLSSLDYIQKTDPDKCNIM